MRRSASSAGGHLHLTRAEKGWLDHENGEKPKQMKDMRMLRSSPAR
jgi:hypothetical protein